RGGQSASVESSSPIPPRPCPARSVASSFERWSTSGGHVVIALLSSSSRRISRNGTRPKWERGRPRPPGRCLFLLCCRPHRHDHPSNLESPSFGCLDVLVLVASAVGELDGALRSPRRWHDHRGRCSGRRRPFLR